VDRRSDQPPYWGQGKKIEARVGRRRSAVLVSRAASQCSDAEPKDTCDRRDRAGNPRP
jgi:hypothetical protein